MDLPTPPQAVAALAAFVRDRLVEVSDTLAPLWNRRDDVEIRSAPGEELADSSVVAAARQLAMVIVGAAAPFAPTSYSRARLIRQMHASGLLSGENARQTQQVLDLEPDPHTDVYGAPR
jgi:hypothetical protein